MNIHLIFGIVIGFITYAFYVNAKRFILAYLFFRKLNKAKNELIKNLEAQGIKVLQTREEVEQYLKTQNKEHLKLVESDEFDDAKDPRNNN